MADAHVSLASVAFYYEWDWAGAESGFLRAIQLDPHLTLAHALYALSLTFLGRHTEASIETRKALELEPLGQAPNLILALYLQLSGQIEAAVEQYRKLVDLHPDCFHAHTTMAIALFQCSRFDECIESAHKAAKLAGVSYPLVAAGLACASSGRRKQAIEMLERLDQESKKSYVPGIYPAILALRLGRLIQAFHGSKEPLMNATAVWSSSNLFLRSNLRDLSRV